MFRRKAADILKELTNIDDTIPGDEDESSDLEDEPFELESDESEDEVDSVSVSEPINTVVQRNLHQLYLFHY